MNLIKITNQLQKLLIETNNILKTIHVLSLINLNNNK